MNRSKPFVFLLTVFFGIQSITVDAQINLKAGYNISFLSDPGFNQVLETFSDQKGYTSSFDKLSWLHGFEAGLRYKNGNHAIELTYQNGYQQLKAKGELIGSSVAYTDKVKVSLQSGAFGYYVTGEIFGMGADLQYQWYRTKVELTEPAADFKDIQKMMGMKFYCVLTLHGSGGVDAAVQPYYILPFDAYDHDPLSYFLSQEPGPAPKKWSRFGLSFLFYNGQK